ncbi:MAG: hypothetical protein H7Y43_06325 [Akkermansiaceae bacterium]|nr:hypothetical protein [Verrucomicrobiales bacterium]
MKTRIKLLALIALSLCLVPRVSAVQATFQVNMSVQTSLGVFDPANDFVFVASGVNGWSPSAWQLTPSPTNSDLYVGTFDVGAAGTFPNYKFIKNRLVGGVLWENDGVGAGGSQNRFFQVPATDTTLDVVYFNNITNVAVNHAEVTFQLNMAVQIAQGAFDPVSGYLTVAGNALNDWHNDTAPIVLTQSVIDTNLWTVTLSVTNPVGSPVAFKYIMNGTWESIPDRTFIMTNVARTLPVVYFNNVTNTAVPIPLTFSVNLGVQQALGNFDPENGGTVEVRGSFNMGPGSVWLGGFFLTNGPSNPLIYSGTFVDTGDSLGSQIQYQFVLNGGATWEAAVGNRIATLTSTNEMVFPLVFFNNVNNLGSVALGPISGGLLPVSWTAGTHVRLQSSTNLISWQNVADTEAQSSANISVTGGVQFYRLVGP